MSFWLCTTSLDHGDLLSVRERPFFDNFERIQVCLISLIMR